MASKDISGKSTDKSGDTASDNIARQQEMKTSTHRTGAGETSTTRGLSNTSSDRNLDNAGLDGQVSNDSVSDVETGAVADRNFGARTGDDHDSRNH